jgi:ketosteroid isomerase-like protein
MRLVAPATSIELEAQVRALWDAYRRGGVDAVAEVVGRDVEWRPAGASGEGDVWGEWGRRHAERVSPVLHGLERHGDCVLARGSLRIFREGGFVDVQPSWAYFFRDGRLVRAVGYLSRAEALAAIREFSAAP